jgi:hypothetical protein
MLRDHGPSDPGFLLVMLVLGTYMDKQGFAYPGQPTWAKAARMSTRMLQRYIARGRSLEWLVVVNAGRGGRGWAYNGYRCCIPDGIQLDEKDEAIADAIVAQAGDIEGGDDTMMSSPSGVGSDMAMSSPSGKPSAKPLHPEETQTVSGAASPVDSIQGLTPVEHGVSTVLALSPDVPRLEGDDTASMMVTTSGAFGDDKSRNLVATQLWRTNSRSENSHSENSRKSLKVGLPATTHTLDPDEKLRAKAEEKDEQKRASIVRLLKVGADEAHIVRSLGKSQGVTVADVRRAVTLQQQEAM